MNTKSLTHGYFVIERTAIPRILTLFEKYGIHATWATVGMAMTRNKRELLSLLPPPHLQPVYEDIHMSSYEYIRNAIIGDDEKTDLYHFGTSLILLIQNTPHQEIGNHTFSHYYGIDGRMNDTTIFARDLDAHTAISQTYALKTESMVFPRNQTGNDMLQVCSEKGIRAYRGNENHLLYHPRKETDQSLLIRGFRLLDHYINLSGHHTYPLPKPQIVLPLNVPSSRFLRPWNAKLQFFESLRMRRIKNSMTYAAKNHEIFHLWWHPHNFGINQEENFKNLEIILEQYAVLQKKYHFESASMRDIANL